MKLKKIGALVLAGALAVSALVGCGGLDKNATFATYGDGEKVTLGVANFLARYQQVETGSYLAAWGMGGDEMWSQDLTGTGSTLEATVKDQVATILHDYYTLKAHMSDYNITISDEQKARITEVATEFMNANSKEALKEMGATQEIVEEVLELYTIYNLMYAAITADVDTNVSDEEANMRGYQIVNFPITSTDESGNSVVMSEEEVAEVQGKAMQFLAAANEKDADFKAVAEEMELTAGDRTYASDDTALDAALKAALDECQAGDPVFMVTGEKYIYVAKLVTETDEEATKANRETIISKRQSDYYTQILVSWKANDGWTIDEKNWAKVKFDDYFTTSTESTESTEQ